MIAGRLPVRPAAPARERGAALFVVLVLVLVGSLLGVSAMESSSTEALLVNNERYRESAFRAAEAAAGQAVRAVDLTAAVGASGDQAATVASVDPRVAVEASTRFEGVRPLTGFSFGTFNDYLLSAEAEARIDGVGTVRRVRQGVARRGQAVGQ